MNVAQNILIALVQAYRWVLSPAKTLLFGPLARCRFTPTCSEYALEAIQRHGAMRGSILSMHRVCRCHPWGDCGHDPVPALASREVQTFTFAPGVARHSNAETGSATAGNPPLEWRATQS